MSWPTVRDNNIISLLVTRVINVWESSPQYSQFRFYDQDIGFGSHDSDIVKLENGDKVCSPLLNYSIIKLQIDGKYQYGIINTVGSEDRIKNYKGAEGYVQIVQLLEENQKGKYDLSDKHYAIKIYFKKYPEIDYDKAEKLIAWLEDNDKDCFNQRLLNKEDFPEEYKDCFSMVRITDPKLLGHGQPYAYALRLEEDSAIYRYDESGNYVRHERIYVPARNREYSIDINESAGTFNYVKYAFSKPVQSAINESVILNHRKMGGDVFTACGHTFVGMRLAKGTDLEKYIDSQAGLEWKVQAKNIIEIMRGCLRALDGVKRDELAHRDLKPANIMFDPGAKRSIEIVDYGCSVKAKETGKSGYVGTFGYYPLYQASLQVVESGSALTDSVSPAVKYNEYTDHESMGRTLYSLLQPLEDGVCKRRAQIYLLLIMIFAQKPEISCSTKIKEGLEQTYKNIVNVDRLKPSAKAAYNNVFLHYFKKASEGNDSALKLFEMAETRYEQSKQYSQSISEKKYYTTYSAVEFNEIKKGKQQLPGMYTRACDQTAVALLYNYASIWAMIFGLHWGRNNRGLVNKYLRDNPNATLADIICWAKQNVIGQGSINQEGSLVRRCLFICSMEHSQLAELQQQTSALAA